jgi:LPS-assembly protein
MKSLKPHSRITVLLLSFLLSFSFLVHSEEDTAKKTPAKKDIPVLDIFSSKQPADVEAVGDQIEYARNSKTITAKGNVVIRYEDTHITADFAEVETETKKVHAKGHVIVFKNETPIAEGEEIFYDFKNNSGRFPDGRALSLPWIVRGVDIHEVKEGVKIIRDGSVTTCDLKNPHYEVKAKKVTIYDGNKMVAQNIKLYVLGKPIFWWPYFVFPLQYGKSPITISAGYSSRFGYYVETSKGISITKNVSGKLHADWRSRRGFGAGGDVKYNFENVIGEGIFKGYLTQDKRAPAIETPNPFSTLERRRRGRIYWAHRSDLDQNTNLILRYNRVADEYFLQEFFRRESQAEVDPQSFATMTHNNDKFGILTHVEKKMNSFEATVERLPEVRFDWKTQPFFHPGLYYENQYSFANLNRTFSRIDENQNALRYDGYNEWSAPLKWKEIKLTPFFGLRGTEYSREREDDDSRFRVVYTEGADLRTHAYKTFSNVEFDTLGIEVNQLRHVVEPNVQIRTQTSTVSDERLHEFDSIDRIDDAHILTLGLENRLQTKRVIDGRMQRVDIVSLNTYVSYEMHPDGKSLASRNYAPFEDGHTSSNFSILGQEITLRPYQWLQFESKFDYDIKESRFRIFNQDFILKRGPFRWIFGHRFIQDIGSSEGSNQFIFDGSWVINPLWKVGGFFRWDAEKKGRDEYQFSATRDLHDFLLEFGYNVRNSSIENSNKTVFVDFRLKAFPILSAKAGNRASFSEPRIGETVSGSNAPSEAIIYS